MIHTASRSLVATVCAAVAYALLVAVPGPVRSADTLAAQIVEQAITEVFRPAANALATSTTQLADALAEDCQSAEVRSAFVTSVQSFSRVEYYRLGAMNQDNRAERLFFWPDRKGIGQRQLHQLLADPDRATLSAEALASKSVALQGLPALERILYTGTRPIDTANCVVASAIAGNMARIADELQTDWQSENGVAASLSNPAPTSLYRSNKEAVASLLTLVESGLQALSDRKLSLLVEALEQRGEIAKSAALWRSEQTLENVRGNLDGLKRLLIDSGLAEAAALDGDLGFELKTAGIMLDAAEAALAEGDTVKARDRLAALESITRDVNLVILDSVAPALGVETGFNAGDGD